MSAGKTPPTKAQQMLDQADCLRAHTARNVANSAREGSR